MEREEQLRAELRELANRTFPATAKGDQRYPIKLNHCFLRVVYDNLVEDKWRRVLTGEGPAINQLTGEQLERAVELGEAITADPDLCRTLNQRSVEWRGKA